MRVPSVHHSIIFLVYPGRIGQSRPVIEGIASRDENRMTRYKAACAAALIVFWAAQATAHLGGVQPVSVLHGPASWYGAQFQGKPTASGEPFDQKDLTAAHKELPFGTEVRVTNQANGRSVIVRINDRGPFVGKRIIDLSRGAAERIGLIKRGVAPVKLEVLPRI